MERAGRLVGRWVDTSADAPSGQFEEKRDLYDQLAEQENEGKDQ